jgi:hypothetical protein
MGNVYVPGIAQVGQATVALAPVNVTDVKSVSAKKLPTLQSGVMQPKAGSVIHSAEFLSAPGLVPYTLKYQA